MKQKELSRWLKAIVAVCWVICGVMGFFVAPWVFRQIAEADPALAHLTPTRLIVFWAALLPVIAALGLGWRIFDEIGRDNSFCLANARRLKVISYLAAGDTVLTLVYSLILLPMNALYPAQLLLHLGIIFVGVAVAIATAALSHLTHKAALLQDENDLTI